MRKEHKTAHRVINSILLVLVSVNIPGYITGLKGADNWIEVFVNLLFLVMHVTAFWVLVGLIRQSKPVWRAWE